MRRVMAKLIFVFLSIFLATDLAAWDGFFISREEREAKREKEMQELQRRFEWWPTDAKPGPVKDPKRGGY